MPIKAYVPISPPTLPTNLPNRRISALIIEEDLSDIESADSSWFVPANVFEKITLSQKEINIPTAADTSRRPSISLARLQTRNLDDIDINCPTHTSGSAFAKRDTRRKSQVFFHSPLTRSRTYSEYSSSSSSGSESTSGSESGYESPVFFPDTDSGCECDCEIDESEISKSASSLPIEVPKRKRRGCFVQDDVMDEDEQYETSVDDNETLEEWVQFAYTPATSFEAALISEVVRRRKSDERFANLIHSGEEKALESAQFREGHRRNQWIKDMVKWYPEECGSGHFLPANC